MNLKELMKEYLQEEGFKVKEEDYGIEFRYHGMNFLCADPEGDDTFLQISMPNIYRVDEENRLRALELCNMLTWNRKVVKLAIINDTVWINFEVLVDTTPELGDIVPRALTMISQTFDAFCAGIEKEDDEVAQ